MNIKVLGSGGFLPIPRATCSCRICLQARKKGLPYQRRGPSFYIKEISAVFDTPEDINESLNIHKVGRVENIFYTHWHPDHTLGYRVIESLCDADFYRKAHLKPINVYVPVYDFDNFKKIIPGLWFLEKMNYIKIIPLTEKGVKIKNIQIRPLRLLNSSFSSYVLTQKKVKFVLCPDHSILLPINNDTKGADLLIMNLGFLVNDVRGAKQMPRKHRIRNNTGFEKDNLRLIRLLKPKRVNFVHIEEKFNRSPEELKQLERKYSDLNISFSSDGMDIII